METPDEHRRYGTELASGTHMFYHKGITYNPQKNIFIFSDEAIGALRKEVVTIQARLSAERETLDLLKVDSATRKVTRETVDAVTDAMIKAGQSINSIAKFLDRVRKVQKGKKKGGGDLRDATEQVEKKVKKYGNTHFAQIIFLYDEGKEGETPAKVPLIIGTDETLETMIRSLHIRLGLNI